MFGSLYVKQKALTSFLAASARRTEHEISKLRKRSRWAQHFSKIMKLVVFFLLILLIGCKSSTKAPLIAKDETSESEKKNTLFVFVGKKISVSETPQDSNSMDAHFKAKYLILQRVYGTFTDDTIEFEVYDHYGVPGFSHYENALLFVSEYKGTYYHEKYQYFDVYPTKEGKWAGVYHDIAGNDAIPPATQISFAKDVYLPVNIINNNGEQIKLKYSPPYYKIVGDKAYPLYGYSIEELFKAKKNGVLKWRGLFGKGNENWADSLLKVEETPMAEVKKDSNK